MNSEKDKMKKKKDYQAIITDYNKAVRAFKKKEYQKAEELLKEFIKEHDSESEFVDRAKVYLSLSEEKKKDQKISLKTFDDYYQYSVYQLNQGEYKEALKLLSKAKEFKEKEAKVEYLMADVYCLMGENEQCLEHLKKAIKMDKFYGILAQNEIDFEAIKEDKKFKLITKIA